MSIRAHVDGRRLNQLITFERNTPTQSSTGAMIPSWATLKQVHAAVDGAKAASAEAQIAGGIVSKADYTIWVRADVIERYSITVVDRVRWNGKILNIKDIPDQQLQGRLMAMICNTGLNAG